MSSQTTTISIAKENASAIRRRKILKVIQYVIAIVVTLIMIFPLYWMIVSSFKSQDEILATIPTLWPQEWHPENYSNVWSKANFAEYYLNTIIMTAGK